MLRWLLNILVGCKHTWKVMDVANIASRGEVAFQCGGSRSHYDDVYRRTHVSTMACTTCGEVKTIVTRS
jgi:hypothetical protein